MSRRPTRVVAVEGADRLTFLDAVVSQQLTDAAPGDIRGALYLDGHGNPLAIFDVVTLEQRVLLVVPDDALAKEVVDTLGGRTFLSDARFSLTDLIVLGVRGTDADRAVEGIGLAAPPGASTSDATIVLHHDPATLDLLAPAEVAEELLTQLSAAGVERADEHRYERWRIQAGVPAWGREVTAGRLPEELGLLPSHVHLAKGCYPGQEAVARMWMLGRPRRQLAIVAVDADVEEGWEAGSGRARAVLTSRAADQAGAVGLAFVPPDATPGARLEDDDGRGITVERVVGVGRPVPGHDPAMSRRREQR